MIGILYLSLITCPLSLISSTSSDWPQWRGPDRAANAVVLPDSLAPPVLLWEKSLEGDGISGVVATEVCVIVADRDRFDTKDIFRCFDAQTGEERWKFSYDAPGRIDPDYGSSPRATPLIHGNRLYTLGGFGHLHCVDLAVGKVLWDNNLPVRFSAKMPKWGYCGSPLLVTGTKNKLIVQPGGAAAQLVAFDPENGEILWQSSGTSKEASYASPICATFSDKPQIIAYDQDALGGYDCETGERIWEHKPKRRGDFNVPTPLVVGERLLLSSENNGTRLFEFDTAGRIKDEPVAQNNDLAPDSSTAVLWEGKIYGVHHSLYCLNAESLQTEGTLEDTAFADYASLIAGKTPDGKKRLLVAGINGDVVLIDIDAATLKLAGRIPADGDNATILAHPAVVGNRLYVRSVSKLRCFEF